MSFIFYFGGVMQYYYNINHGVNRKIQKLYKIRKSQKNKSLNLTCIYIKKNKHLHIQKEISVYTYL